MIYDELGMDTERFSQLTDAIYDAAIDPQRWSLALDEIQRAFRATAVALILRDTANMRGHWLSTHTPEAERDFWGHWRSRNPLAIAAITPRPKVVETDQEILLKSDFLATDYYNEFMRRHDLDAVLMLWLKREGATQVSLSVPRSRSMGEFDEADVALGRLLFPHLQRAIAIEQRLQHTNLAAEGAADVLDILTHGVLVLDATGRPLHLNRAAQRLICDRDGISLDGGQLRGATPVLTHRLGEMIARAAGRSGELPLAGAISLPRPSSKAPLAVIAVPLRRQIEWLHPYQPTVCVCISKPEEAPVVPGERLRAVFGLTEIRHQPLQLSVLLLELLQATDLHHAHPGELVKRGLGYPQLAADLLHQSPVFSLPQSKRDLLVRIPFALHGIPLLQGSGCPKNSHP